MTDAPDIEPAALEAAHKAFERYGQVGDTMRLSDGCMSAVISAFLAASSAPEKAVEEEPVGWAYQDKRWDKGRWHVCGLDSKPRAHEGREIRAIYIASNGGALASVPAPSGAEPTQAVPAEDVARIAADLTDIASLLAGDCAYKQADTCREAAAALTASEAVDLRRKLEEARKALEVIASSDDIENALDPARNKRVARQALESDNG